MKILSERNQIIESISNWVEMQRPGGIYSWGERGLPITDKVLSLDQDTATQEDVAAIIGHHEWVKKRECDECGKATWRIVELDGAESGSSVYVCSTCLARALQELEMVSE